MVRFALWRAAVTKSAPVVRAIVGSMARAGDASVDGRHGRLPRSGGVSRSGLRVGVGRSVEALAGDGEEHLIEARAAQADVVDLDAPFVEQADDVAELVPASVDAGGDALTIHVGLRRVAADPGQRLLDCGKVAAGPWPDFDHVARRPGPSTRPAFPR